MDLGTIANVATALTVLVGVAFGLVEMRRARRDREERAAFAAVQALNDAGVDEFVDDRAFDSERHNRRATRERSALA